MLHYIVTTVRPKVGVDEKGETAVVIPPGTFRVFKDMDTAIGYAAVQVGIVRTSSLPAMFEVLNNPKHGVVAEMKGFSGKIAFITVVNLK